MVGSTTANLDYASVSSTLLLITCYAKTCRKQYPRAYEPWNADEDKQLRLQYNQRESIDALAVEFQRQPSAIRSRLKRLGLL